MALKLSPKLESTIARNAEAHGLTPEAFLLSLIRLTGIGEAGLDSLQTAASGPEDDFEVFYGLWKRNGHPVDVEHYLDSLRSEWR